MDPNFLSAMFFWPVNSHPRKTITLVLLTIDFRDPSSKLSYDYGSYIRDRSSNINKQMNHENIWCKDNHWLNLYCDERRDIQWNIAWARGKSRGRRPRGFARAQAIFDCISRIESQYRHSHLILQHCPSRRSILEELILCIAPTAGQYWKILPSRWSNTGGLNFNI